MTHLNPSCIAKEQDNPQAQVNSLMPMTDWRGAITFFHGFTGTLPVAEHIDLTWIEVCKLLCPNSPLVIVDKQQAQFFVPCALKVAPLVGNTLASAIKHGNPVDGKMRSRSHVTVASMLVVDVDGVDEADFNKMLVFIHASSITYQAFTTHSHGSESKPGMRTRIVIPIDRPVGIDEYQTAWRGFDVAYLKGLAGKADSSSAHLYQQQGTWCCHPDRRNLANSWRNDGVVVSADALITMGAAVTVAQSTNEAPSRKESKLEGKSNNVPKTAYPPSDANKIANACPQIRAFRDTKGKRQREPLWFDCLGVVGYCVDGENLCQEWSSAHPEYSEEKTSAKLAYRLKTGPTTCEQFKKTYYPHCHGCHIQVQSPIKLGYADSFAIEGNVDMMLNTSASSGIAAANENPIAIESYASVNTETKALTAKNIASELVSPELAGNDNNISTKAKKLLVLLRRWINPSEIKAKKCNWSWEFFSQKSIPILSLLTLRQCWMNWFQLSSYTLFSHLSKRVLFHCGLLLPGLLMWSKLPLWQLLRPQKSHAEKLNCLKLSDIWYGIHCRLQTVRHLSFFVQSISTRQHFWLMKPIHFSRRTPI